VKRKILAYLELKQKKDVTDLDDPNVTLLHGEIIQQKPFLRKIYVDFYNRLKNSVADTENKTVVELGSGGGFIKEIIPAAITTEVMKISTVDRIFSATDMPFEDQSIDAFVMIDVLHHIQQPRLFFKEATRCLTDGGKIVMIEPSATPWARFIYKNFHHEGFDVNADWELGEGGALSNGNDAMPWIIFTRDRAIFKKEFEQLKIRSILNHTPLLYLLSGGLTLRQLAPTFTWPIFRAIEWLLLPMRNIFGMFQTIVLQHSKGD
jgi:SAM-dependent methyltransferase